MNELKKILLLAVDAAISAAPSLRVRAALGLMRWLLEKYVPEGVEAPKMVGASGDELVIGGSTPDVVREFVRVLLEEGRKYVNGRIALAVYDAAVRLLEGELLDVIWEALTGKRAVVMMSAGPGDELAEAVFAAACDEPCGKPCEKECK